jgi:hypothetical protein
MGGSRDSKRKKRGCQKEKQPVKIWIDHDDDIPPPRTPPPAIAAT